MPNMTPTIFPAMNISATDVDNLVNLMRTVSYKLLFDLNLLLRYGIQWDPTNTADLLGYVNKMKYHDVFNFELGNGKNVRFLSRSSESKISHTHTHTHTHIILNVLCIDFRT